MISAFLSTKNTCTREFLLGIIQFDCRIFLARQTFVAPGKILFLAEGNQEMWYSRIIILTAQIHDIQSVFVSISTRKLQVFCNRLHVNIGNFFNLTLAYQRPKCHANSRCISQHTATYCLQMVWKFDWKSEKNRIFEPSLRWSQSSVSASWYTV